MRIRFFIFAVVISIGMAADEVTAESGLRKDLQAILIEEGLTGVAWSLVDSTGEVSLGAIGKRDGPNQTDFTTDTRFHVGSVTKSLLATGVLRLVSQGLISLDAPVSGYLSELVFENPWSGEAAVTVRRLLDHTSGLNDAHLWQMFSERPTADTPLIAAFPDPQLQLQIRSRPGTRFSYSNMGYTLLGMVIEAVTDERYETYLYEYLLMPLGMNDSTFSYTTQEGESADIRLAWGHVDDGSRIGASPIFLRPAGQLTSTAGDMALYAQFLLGNGAINGVPFISEDLMRDRGRPYGTEAAAAGLEAGYALGLGRRDRHGAVGYCHGGNIVGFVAMVCIFPEENKAFAYSVNTDSETANYGRIDGELIRALGVTPVPQPPSVEPPEDMARWYGRYILSPNRFQAFRYLDTVFGAVRVSANGQSLTVTSLQQSPRELRPLGGRIYSAQDRATASHVFLQGEDGEYLISDGFKTWEMVSSAYLLAHWGSVLLGLLGIGWLWSAGVISLIRHRTHMMKLPEAPAFAAILALVVPIPFFMTQSFMALGDLTLASVLLAAVTFLLPVAMLITLIRSVKVWRESKINLLHGLAAVLVLQWCVVLFAAKMLPWRLWA
jgi:CubicO group peptidase (beta-lactamase class C family)